MIGRVGAFSPGGEGSPGSGFARKLVPRGAGWLLLSGLLLAVAHPPFHLLIPSFVALVPFVLWTALLPRGPEGRAEALRGGFFLGLVYFTLVLYWLVVSLIFYTPLAILAFLLPVLILSGFLALVTLAIHQTTGRTAVPIWLAFPIFWTAMEWLRAHLGDVSFPWMHLGDTLTGYPWLVGFADLTGSRGVTFWLVLVNALVAAVLLRWGPGRRLGGIGRTREADTGSGPSAGGDSGSGPPPGEGAGDGGAGRPGGAGTRALLVGLALAVAVPAAYSLHRYDTLELEPAATVGIVQPNVPQDIKLDTEEAVDSTLTSTATLVRRHLTGSAGELDLLILPEATLPNVLIEGVPSLGHPGRPDLRDWMGDLARALDAAVLYGATGTDDPPGEEWDYFNSAFLKDSAGRSIGRYDKRELVPVVERVPFVNPDSFDALEFLGPYFGGFTKGRRTSPMETAGSSFGVLICYESIFTQLGRDYRRAGAEYLVNVTNDAWYGREEPRWSRTTALWQHPAHLVMRAIETRMGIARAANTGISQTVDPLGRVHHETELFTADAFVAEITTTDGLTPYARFGDVIGWTAALAALGLAVVAGLRT